MYVPRHFAEPDRARVSALIERYSFGLLVSGVAQRPFATHVPFLRDGDDRLLCHLARANPQSQIVEGTEVLAIITGPHAYVSPSWYAAPGVPTWNYAVAHVYGRATLVTAHQRLREIVERLTAAHEAGSSNPWKPDYSVSMLDHIVGVEIAISEIQGKFKLSQNRSAADRSRVIERLLTRGSDDDVELAMLMSETVTPTPDDGQ